jgi:hypothetical protein
MVILVSSRTCYIAVDQQDDLYDVSDYYNNAIHKFSLYKSTQHKSITIYFKKKDVIPIDRWIETFAHKHSSKYGYEIEIVMPAF